MRATIAVSFAAVLAAIPGSSLAQEPPRADAGYVAAPWWMREPVVASIGYVRTELQANRADFEASFKSVDASAAKAMEKAAAQIRVLTQALERVGGDKVRIETSFEITPLYDQYRDKDGRLVDNRRADKIDRYEAAAVVSIEITDPTVVQRVYATVIAARPTSTESLVFRLVPDNETKSRMYEEAVKDAARRARSAVSAAGGTLGAVKVIDPTGRTCDTDVLAQRPSRGPDGMMPTQVDGATVTGSRIVRQDFEAISPVTTTSSERLELTATLSVDSLLNELPQITVQPPLEELTARACVVYAIG